MLVLKSSTDSDDLHSLIIDPEFTERASRKLFFLRQLQYKILAESVDDFNISTL